MHICVHINAHTHTHTYRDDEPKHLMINNRNNYVNVHTFMCVCMHKNVTINYFLILK